MLFNSYEFMLLFLPTVLLLWWLLRGSSRARLTILVIGSYIFYGWNKWEFVSLLAISTCVDYVVGWRLHKETNESRRVGWLLISLGVNLGMLGFFKYCGFFGEAIGSLLTTLRLGEPLDLPRIALPIGISFYTFQTLSYSIDLYRRQIQPARSFLHFAAYVSMFPQLIAGPIVRYKDIEEQMQDLATAINWDQFSRGIWFFVIGLSQKLLVADTAAEIINPLLDDVSNLQLVGGWYCLLGYSVQLYFDFTGYSSMAVGLGFMMGFRFPQNFDSPYKASSIQEFWRRWHITLSSFLRDYLYFPLGGSRSGKLISIRNLIIVMFLGGLWHGAGWTFVLWGCYHGLLLACHAVYSRITPIRMPRVAATACTFFVVLVGWLIFRSTDLNMAGDWLNAVSGMNGIEPSLLQDISLKGIAVLSVALGVCFFAPNIWQVKMPRSLAGALVVGALLWFCILRFDAESPFLYFQF